MSTRGSGDDAVFDARAVQNFAQHSVSTFQLGGRLVRSIAEARMSIALAEELRCYLRELRRRREPRVEVARG